jgi:2-polyprenyl-6-methoxyphenol hydroxylase-like FAD-dependent oxidoreductase
MNLGIEDGVLLGEALSRVLQGDSAEILDSYAATRRPAAEKVVALADRLTRLATISSGRRPLRNVTLGVLGRMPAVRRRLAWQLAGLDRRPVAGR